MKGYYLVLEGGEGTGKSTQINSLKDRFAKLYPQKELVLTREPGGTKVSEAIRQILLDMDLKKAEIDPVTEAYLFAASRAQLLREVVKPALARGSIVIADRCVLSSVAYQGISRGLGMETIWKINQIAVGELIPDLTVLIDIDPQIGLARINNRGKIDRLDQECLEFHQKVRWGYLEQVYKLDWPCMIIDGRFTPQEQHHLIWEHLHKDKLFLETVKEFHSGSKERYI